METIGDIVRQYLPAARRHRVIFKTVKMEVSGSCMIELQERIIKTSSAQNVSRAKYRNLSVGREVALLTAEALFINTMFYLMC